MKTLNDKWLGIAVKEKEKKNRIKEHRDELNSNDNYILENAWNEYIEHFGPNGCRNGKRDRVLVDAKGYVNWIRGDIEQEKDYILDDNTTFGFYGNFNENDFFEKTEKLFNS